MHIVEETYSIEKETAALKLIKEALSKYGPSSCAVSFNGGKDCTVLLDLIYRCWPMDSLPISVCYVANDDPFPEVETFIKHCQSRYQVKISRIESELKGGFTKYLRENPHIKLIFVGVRRTDPHCFSLHSFDLTDNGWPLFTRCHPILDWTYFDIWAYLRAKTLEYCSLYDQGYTSLGSRAETRPNPKLLVERSETMIAIGTYGPQYHPAYALEDEKWERAGRSSNSNH